MSGSLKTTPLLVVIVFQICVAVNHSAELVRIANRQGDSPIGVIHLCLVQPSTSSCFGPLGNIVLLRRATRQLLLSSADSILSFGSQHTGTKGEECLFEIRHLHSVILRIPFHCSFLIIFSLFFRHSVHAFFQSSNT